MKRQAAINLSLRGVLLAASAAAIVQSLWFAWSYFQATPWLDMWDWVGEFRAWPEGHFGWRNLIAEHNDHRIATARVLFLLDTLLFRMSGRFIATVNILLLGALGVLIHRVWRGRAVSGTRDDLPAVFFVAVALSLCQWENLVTPFQVQFALLLVFAVLATILLVQGTSSALPSGQSAWFLLAAGVNFGLAAFSMAGGVLLLPVLVALLFIRRTRLVPALCFAVPAALALLLFFHHYAWHSFGVPLKIAGPTPLLIAYRMAGVGMEFIGSAFGGLGGGTAIVAGACGLVVLAGLLVRAWRWRHRLAGSEAVFMALAVFVAANAVAAARLRGYFSFWGGLASRYASLSLLFFICLAGAAVQAMRHRDTGGGRIGRQAGTMRATVTPLLALLALAAFNLPPTFAQQAASLQRALQTAGTTLRQGVYAPTRISILNPFGLDRVIDNVRFAEHSRLSVFATSGRPPARIRSVLSRLDPGRLAACLGAEDMLYRLDASRGVLRAWLATSDPTQTIQWVELLGSNGRAAAVLPAQELRDEDPLGPKHAPIMGVFAGFTAALADGPLTLIGIPGSGAPCRLSVRGPGPVRIQAPPEQRPASLPTLSLGPLPAAWAQVKPTSPPRGWPLRWRDGTHAGPTVWTSEALGDVGTGELTMRVAPPDAGMALVVPFAVGPSPVGQSLIFRTADGAQIDLPAPGDTQPGQWRLAALPAEWLADHAGVVTITARDQGTGNGQWLAVAAPMALRLDPEAARLDADQTTDGWPSFTLLPSD